MKKEKEKSTLLRTAMQNAKSKCPYKKLIKWNDFLLHRRRKPKDEKAQSPTTNDQRSTTNDPKAQSPNPKVRGPGKAQSPKPG